MLSSCRGDGSEPGSEHDGRIAVNMSSSMTRSASESMRIYMFNGLGASHGMFHTRLLQIERNENLYTARNVATGTWDLALVTTADGSGMDEIADPLPGQSIEDAVMFRLTPDNGTLPQTPEIMTGYVYGQQIQSNQTNYAPDTDLYRNVAMVKVIIKEPRGWYIGSNHKVMISNIPTTIAWDGRLLPSPEVPYATAPGMTMSEPLTITDIGEEYQHCSEAIFIVPAHKGVDFTKESPADTTECKLKLAVDLTTLSGERYVKGPIEVPVTPKANKILVINLIPTEASLDIKFDVTPWRYEQNEIIFE